MHQDQLVELPDEAEIFLSSDFCPISGFTIGESVFAIQQHPDFTTGINRDLIARRRDRIGDDVARVAIESLEGRDDTSTSVEWLAEFFKRAVSSATAGSKASN